jgi:hypothetical protein
VWPRPHHHSTVPGTIVPMTVGVAIQADTNYEKVNNALYVIPLGMYVVRQPATRHQATTVRAGRLMDVQLAWGCGQDIRRLLPRPVASHPALHAQVLDLQAAADHHGAFAIRHCAHITRSLHLARLRPSVAFRWCPA